MSDRWSNPSGGLGIDRFRVWPAGTDSYSSSDLANNWDTLDAILGIPASGTWPPSTGIGGGIYKEVALLQDERAPIGTVTAWFRPTGSTPIPSLWAACDGSVLTSGHHNFPGIGGSVTLPDLRNKFILGADATLGNGAAAAAVGDGDINTASGAPGAQAAGGSNKIVQTTGQLPSHTHTFAGNALASHTHAFTGSALGPHHHFSVDDVDADFRWDKTFAGNGTKRGFADIGGMTGSNQWFEADTLNTSSNSAGTPVGNNSSISAGTPSGTLSSVGSGSPMDNRPNWIGLIYIVKVLYATTP